jgi:hypothetical protein
MSDTRNGCVGLWPAKPEAVLIPGGRRELRDRMADHAERGRQADRDDAEEDRIAGLIERFNQKQNRTRWWIRLAEIADWCAREVGSIRRIEKDYVHTLWQLHDAVGRGEFESHGRMRILFLHESLCRTKLTREEYDGANRYKQRQRNRRSFHKDVFGIMLGAA